MTTRNEAWNGKKEFPITGRYFELLETVNAVDVEFFDIGGNTLSKETQVRAGFWVDRRGVEEFARFEITTGALEYVKFIATDGMSGSRAATGHPIGATHVPAKKTVTSASAQMLAANAYRRYLAVQNQNFGGTIYVRGDGAAATADAACIQIAPGQIWEPRVPPIGAVMAIGDIASNPDISVIEV